MGRALLSEGPESVYNEVDAVGGGDAVLEGRKVVAEALLELASSCGRPCCGREGTERLP